MNNDEQRLQKKNNEAGCSFFGVFLTKILLDGEIFENLKGSCFFSFEEGKNILQDGPLLVINGGKTSINGLING